VSLQLRSVTVRYGTIDAVTDVDLEVASGERLAVMGPSGAGKSSLLRVIAGLEALVEGSITLDGVDIGALPAHRRSVGMMFQDYALFPHLSVADNVEFGLRMAGVDAATRTLRSEQLLETVGLDGYGHRPTTSLSGGERQRVALARTLAPRPSVVLLDEPLGSVDQILKDGLISEMRDILTDLGITSIYVTHDRYEAETFASRVAIMRAGRVMRVGTPAEIWDDPGTTFVARFMGHRNVVRGSVLGAEAACVLVMPSAITIDPSGGYEATVRGSTFRDGAHRADVVLGGDTIEIETHRPLAEGETVTLAIDETGLRELIVDEI
jgi:thiamine transport system ATP-binding protein